MLSEPTIPNLLLKVSAPIAGALLCMMLMAGHAGHEKFQEAPVENTIAAVIQQSRILAQYPVDGFQAVLERDSGIFYAFVDFFELYLRHSLTELLLNGEDPRRATIDFLCRITGSPSPHADPDAIILDVDPAIISFLKLEENILAFGVDRLDMRTAFNDPETFSHVIVEGLMGGYRGEELAEFYRELLGGNNIKSLVILAQMYNILEGIQVESLSTSPDLNELYGDIEYPVKRLMIAMMTPDFGSLPPVDGASGNYREFYKALEPHLMVLLGNRNGNVVTTEELIGATTNLSVVVHEWYDRVSGRPQLEGYEDIMDMISELGSLYSSSGRLFGAHLDNNPRLLTTGSISAISGSIPNQCPSIL